MRRAIKLLPTFQASADPLDGVGVRFSVTATAADGLPDEVFLFGVRPARPGAPAAVADFQCVCTPPDLADYPAGEPTPGMDPPFFRLAAVTLDFRSRKAASAAYEAIAADVVTLLDTLDRMDEQIAVPPLEFVRGV